MTTGNIKQCEIETHHAQGAGRSSCRCGFKKYPSVDAKRPHETMPCNCPTDGECANECTACQYAADNAWDCDHQGAAVHQVAKFAPVERVCTAHCEHDSSWMRQGECMFSLTEFRDFPSYCGHRCTFAPAEVHQTPESQDDLFADCRDGNHSECLYQWPDPANPDLLITCGCSHHLASLDQHVAPPRIWLGKDDGAADWHVAAAMFGEIEYLAAVPVKAALEACEREALHPDGRISFRRSDYDALVKAVKGEK